MTSKFESFLDRTFNKIDIIFLSLLAFVFSLLRLPSIIEPYWYGDEGVYEVIGRALASGRILYSQIWDNKPPLLYVIYAIFSGDQFYVRLVSAIVGIFSLVIFFMIARKFFRNQIAVYVSTVFFALFLGAPILEGNIANAENFMVLPTLTSFYILFCTSSLAFLGTRFSKAQNWHDFFSIRMWQVSLAGFILSLTFLTKIVAIFDFAAFFVILFSLRFFDEISFRNVKKIINGIKNVIDGFQMEAIYATAFALPIFMFIVYFIVVGAFPDFFKAVFSQNVGYVASGNYFLFPNGFLYFKLFLLLLSILIVTRYRKIVTREGLIIFIWLAFSMFNAFFSARPYTHYLLVLLPSFSLFVGYILEKRRQGIVLIPLILILAIIIQSAFKLNFKRVVPYYINYLSYITAEKSVTDYQAFFDRNTPRDYELAQFIRSKTSYSDNIFIWGDNAQVYFLSGKLPPGRYTVSYHITFYKDAINETHDAILKSRPKYIIQTKEGDEIQNFLDGFELRYKIENAKIYERQF